MLALFLNIDFHLMLIASEKLKKTSPYKDKNLRMGKRQGGGSRDGVDLGKGRPGRGLAGDKGRSWLTGTPGTRVPPHPQTSAEGPEVGCSSRRRKRGLLCKLHSTAGTPGPLASGSCCRCLGAVESTWVQDTGQGGMRQQYLPGAGPPVEGSVSGSEAGGSSRAIL